MLLLAKTMLGGRAAPATFSAIYTPTTPNNSFDMGMDGYSMRQVTTATIPISITQVRVTLVPPTGRSGGRMQCDHMAIGVKGAAAFQTTAVPIELKIAGASGCNILATGANIVTDIALLTANAGDKLVVILDFTNTGGGNNGNNYRIGSSGDGGYIAGSATYNTANPAGLTSAAYVGMGFSLIEGL